MAKQRLKIDKVRASRDGHEYHETWTARKATQLLWPNNNLKAIAVEGLSPPDQAKASANTVEIADITLYFGNGYTFEQAERITIVQFKYSVAYKDNKFRAADARRTTEKFSKTYSEYIRIYGSQAVKDKLDFQLITNQPISQPLLQAIDALAHNAPCEGDVDKQASQFQKDSGLGGNVLATFAEKLKLIGPTDNLQEIKVSLKGLLVDWSATNDLLAAARLGKLKALVRDKAGNAGNNQNIITRMDILAALEIEDPKDLLPCEPALADVGKILERNQLSEAVERIANISEPMLIHASGGVGKTVFMHTLTAQIRDDHEVVFFDCFGGGAYRSPEDARHLPKMGLIHIANTLAFRGLCDPMLPGSDDLQSLLRTFRRRLTQCVKTISRITPGRKLALFIDAIDNAVLAAHSRNEDCFPIELLMSLHTEPVTDVKLIVSCRTERKPGTYALYHEFKLHPFTNDETALFLRERLKGVSSVEIAVAQARSGGNPRVLDYLIYSRQGLLDKPEIDKEIELDDLIQERITKSLTTALEYGHREEKIRVFLAGLAILPPPVPLEEYAGVQGMEMSAIESFASDMRPLLELTSQGLIFRDEPTETLVRKQYASSSEALHLLASNLLERQDQSVYSARALPGLLLELDDGEKLFSLAFDARIPSSITSTIGKRNVRYARLKAATFHVSQKKDYNSLVQLLLELSTIASIDQRGADYILKHPDLVVAAQDADATRRLFEVRTGWPGTRHARLAIAHTLSGEFEEAYRHACAVEEWIEHYRRTRKENEREESGPECPDIAAIPFCLITQGRGSDAERYLKRWYDWYVYEVCEHVFSYSHLAQSLQYVPIQRLSGFLGALTGIGTIAAALSFMQLPQTECKELIIKLAKRCKNTTKLNLQDTFYQGQFYKLQDGLHKSAVIALSMGLSLEAKAISLRAPHQRPRLWSFQDAFSNHNIFPFVFRTALLGAIKNEPIHEKDMLPKELFSICSRIPKRVRGEEFRNKAKDRVSKYVRVDPNKKKKETNSKTFSYEDRPNAEYFLNNRLGPLLTLTKAFSTVLGANSSSLENAYIKLIETWEESTKNRYPYRSDEVKHFFSMLGLDIALFVLWARSDLNRNSVERLLTAVQNQDVGVHNLVHIVAILAQREPLQALAGEQARRARSLIEQEDDVNSRAFLFGALGRALLPASIEEASVYFRDGLEQMDAIGSGDYEFTNELLLFASQMKGSELDERDFHTLTNICELNMGDEPEKFYWGAFGRGLSKAAGVRGLVKLSRWDDRSKIALNNTLLPYLIGLLEVGKIDAKDALALNRIAKPVEYWHIGTKEFGHAMHQQAGTDPAVIAELISQFQDNNPDKDVGDTMETFIPLAEEVLGPRSEITIQLSVERERYALVRDVENERNNYKSGSDPEMNQIGEERDRKNREALKRIAAVTIPSDEVSLIKAINDFNALKNTYDLKGDFFAELRNKVPYNDRSQYIQHIAKLENLFFYWKFTELMEAKLAWECSSAAIASVYRSLAIPLINVHADDLVEDGSLSDYNIKKISDFTGVPVAELVLELIMVFARPDRTIAGSVWLAFATFICPEADAGQGQIALKRLLSSESSRLADNVVDGAWKEGLYPETDFCEIAAGLIWRVLGSPYAIDRWRGAHSIRSFVKFGRWEIVDRLVGKIGQIDAGPFQASELPFFYMHARLWLLIALARMAHDYPVEIARYKDMLLSFALEYDAPHALMRHFASRTLLTCLDAGQIRLPAGQVKYLRQVDLSPHHHLKKKIRKNSGFYSNRPITEPEPSFEFHLDIDFHKYIVDDLARVFGQPCWKVVDLMSEIVHSIDPNVDSMYNTTGRESRFSRGLYQLTTRYHTHAQQLGWHALFLAAGELLKTYPVTDDSWYNDPWDEWFSRSALTRNDGLWLSDGTERTPLDTMEFLLEKKKKGLELTGEREKILILAGLGSHVGKELVIDGEWFSADNVRVNISSALVSPNKAATLARKLTRDEPMTVWVPCFHVAEDGSEYPSHDKEGYVPWIVCPSGEARLDEHDPYGVYSANFRPRLARDLTTFCSLSKDDPFGCIWKDKRASVALRAQVWGREDKYKEDGPHPGMRLFCSSSILKKILAKYDKDLIILINLRRYEKETYHEESKFTYTIAVVRVTKALDLEYFKGRMNYLPKTRLNRPRNSGDPLV